MRGSRVIKITVSLMVILMTGALLIACGSKSTSTNEEEISVGVDEKEELVENDAENEESSDDQVSEKNSVVEEADIKDVAEEEVVDYTVEQLMDALSGIDTVYGQEEFTISYTLGIGEATTFSVAQANDGIVYMTAFNPRHNKGYVMEFTDRVLISDLEANIYEIGNNASEVHIQSWSNELSLAASAVDGLTEKTDRQLNADLLGCDMNFEYKDDTHDFVTASYINEDGVECNYTINMANNKLMYLTMNYPTKISVTMLTFCVTQFEANTIEQADDTILDDVGIVLHGIYVDFLQACKEL